MTYGIAEAVAITCLILTAAAACLAIATAMFLKIVNRPWLRPTLSWVGVFFWSFFTFSVALDYRNQYAALAETLAQQQPAPSDQVATAALILQLQPTMWAAKMILLGLVGAAMWVGMSRARAAAGLLLAYSRMPDLAANAGGSAAPAPVVSARRFAGAAIERAAKTDVVA